MAGLKSFLDSQTAGTAAANGDGATRWRRPSTSLDKDGADDTSAATAGRDSPPPSSNSSSSENQKTVSNSETASSAATARSSSARSDTKGKSLEDRSKIPVSLYVTLTVVFGFQHFAGIWRPETVRSFLESVRTSNATIRGGLEYWRDLCKSLATEDSSSTASTTISRRDGDEGRQTEDYVRAAMIFLSVASLAYVFVIAPFRAGLWTGPRARKHKLHRYMGLSFMALYTLTWVEFFTNYEAAEVSVIPHVVALNGLLQTYSAFFSFKVLPELSDPGYYSDKAVLSRHFIHENGFFSLLVVFGSVYYNELFRETLRTSLGGRILEYTFVFFPFILIRPFFPITRFQNAGTTHKGRTEKNRRYYEVTTMMVKIFFLWAKYFLGFFINFMVFLDLLSPKQWRLMHGMFLLNLGTVSLSIFLHTLRFRKVLPPVRLLYLNPGTRTRLQVLALLGVLSLISYHLLSSRSFVFFYFPTRPRKDLHVFNIHRPNLGHLLCYPYCLRNVYLPS